MSTFKALAIVTVILLAQASFASETCTNSKGETLNIGAVGVQGISAHLKSKTVASYYQKNYKLDASELETVVDPKGFKFDSEQTKDGYRFTMAVPESEVNSIWNLEVSMKGSKAKAQLTDMEGKTFNFSFNCVTGGDLE